MTLTEVAIEIASSQIGKHETPGTPNAGPEVNQYLASVGLAPGHSWCAAFLYWVFRQAARRLGVVNPCPRTAFAVRLFEYAEPSWKDSNPSAGHYYSLDHGGGKGHAGIVVSVNSGSEPVVCHLPDALEVLLGADWPTICSITVPPGQMLEISGNTNKAGSREGNIVWPHVCTTPEKAHGGTLLGYVDLARAVTTPVTS